MEVGDRIMYNGEEGIVVCTSPPIMRVLTFHSYVPVRHVDRVQHMGESDPNTNVHIPEGVRQRIVAYIAANPPYESS